MIPERNNSGIFKAESAVQGFGPRLPYQICGEEPFNWMIQNHFLVLLHAGGCMKADGHFGPHLQCYDKCPFARELYKDFHDHRPRCQGDACTFPYCREAVALHKHFVSCPDHYFCDRCHVPIFAVVDEFAESLRNSGKMEYADGIPLLGYAVWKKIFTYNVIKKWV